MESIFSEAIEKLKEGKGSVIAVTAESGYGKTYLMNKIVEHVRQKESGMIALYVQNESPIGNFNISNIQPLKPFSVALQSLVEGSYKSAQKKFAKRLGLSILAAIPVTGDFFYAIKEISKDWRDYNKDKEKEKTVKHSGIVDEFHDTIRSFASKKPLLIVIDDMQWSDTASVELLHRITQSISDIPVAVFFTYRNSDMEDAQIPLYGYIMKSYPQMRRYEVKPFDRIKLDEMCRRFIKGYDGNEEFLSWIYDKTFGIPGIFFEYVRYFRQMEIFDEAGRLAIDLNDEYLPVTAQSLLGKSLESLDYKERNLLSLCSSEGSEFTAFIIAKLLNTDVLTAIKKLRSLQQKKGIIKSIGAHFRYGVKTTVYQFTQAFYYNYFEKGLEYEEHTALHGQIAQILKLQYDSATTEEEKQQIAPYLAAHATEAEDSDTAEIMMRETAKFTDEFGTPAMLAGSFGPYAPAVMPIEEGMPRETVESHDMATVPAAVAGQASDEFRGVRSTMISDYRQGKFSLVIKRADEHLSSYENYMTVFQKVLLLAMSARAGIEIGEYKEAERRIAAARKLLEKRKDPVSECFIFNTTAILYAMQNKVAEAEAILRKAAQMSFKLPKELRLLTLSNIGLVTQKTDPEKARPYLEAADKLSADLSFFGFRDSFTLN